MIVRGKFMKNIYFTILFMICTLVWGNYVNADDGYRLWLKYDLISDKDILNEYRNKIQAIKIEGESPTVQIIKQELHKGLFGLLGITIPEINSVDRDGIILVGSTNNLPPRQDADLKNKLNKAGNEGFVI
jgi:alpha-glucuronidase